MFNIIKTDDALTCAIEQHDELIPFSKRELFKSFQNIDELKDVPTCCILKHSTICPVSHTAYERVVSAVQNKKIVEPVYLVIVQEQRQLSREIADFFGIQHESPQLLKIQDGKVVEVQNHLEIVR